MIVERTTYWPKAGMAEAVLQTRFEACRVRLDMGLQAGKVYQESGHEESGQTSAIIHWECFFANEAEHAADLQARDQSPEFTLIRQKMTSMIDNFSRNILSQSFSPKISVWDTALDDFPVKPVEHFFSSAGNKLAGYLFLPPQNSPNRRFPCIVWNHGSGLNQGSQDVCRPGSAALLLHWGIAVFMPHRRGYGNSEGMGWREEVNAEMGTPEYDSRLQIRLDKESEDVLAAYNYVRTLPEVDVEHIGVMGSSFGGQMTLLAAAKENRFRCAVEFAGAAMNWEIAPQLRSFLLERAKQVQVPIYYMQAENDYSPRPTRELSEANRLAGNAHVYGKVFPAHGLTRDEGHFLCGQGAELWKKDIRMFLERYL